MAGTDSDNWWEELGPDPHHQITAGLGSIKDPTERRAQICKEFTFEAAHRLPNHQGKCSRPHGHSYTVHIEVEGPIKVSGTGDSDEGMVMDFAEIKEAWRHIEGQLDHRDLNESIGRECWPTTAENIAWWIFRQMREMLGISVVQVTLFETATSSVTVR